MSAYLLDIEGTCAPVAFVYETLFPYARKNLADTLTVDSEEVAKACSLLEAELEEDQSAGNHPPKSGVLDYCLWLMDQDRKSTGLKILQGLAWDAGFKKGELVASLYPDVVPAIRRWKESGKRVFIYSSGSVRAQKLLFGHTSEGDLLPLLDGYFDTTTGPKKISDSYTKIAAEISENVEAIHFLSDSQAEIDAALEASLQATLVTRDSAEGLENFTELP